MAANIGAIHQVEIRKGRLFMRPLGDGAAAQNQNMQAARFSLEFFAKTANIVILGEVDRASVCNRAERLRFLRASCVRTSRATGCVRV